MLARALDCPEIAVHNYLDAPEPLPERCLLQLHWYREPNFQRWLRERQFVTVCVARHPLDILLSVLHFVRYEKLTARWLEGNVELPEELTQATPGSDALADYALGFGFENLLAVSYQWWHDRATHKLRYEDCVADPMATVGRLVESLGGDAAAVAPQLERRNLAYFRAMPNHHGWQGKPGLHKKLIPPLIAYRIYKRHQRVFSMLDYSIDPYFLTYRAAEKNWKQLSTAQTAPDRLAYPSFDRSSAIPARRAA